MPGGPMPGPRPRGGPIGLMPPGPASSSSSCGTSLANSTPNVRLAIPGVCVKIVTLSILSLALPVRLSKDATKRTQVRGVSISGTAVPLTLTRVSLPSASVQLRPSPALTTTPRGPACTKSPATSTGLSVICICAAAVKAPPRTIDTDRGRRRVMIGLLGLCGGVGWNAGRTFHAKNDATDSSPRRRPTVARARPSRRALSTRSDWRREGSCGKSPTGICPCCL